MCTFLPGGRLGAFEEHNNQNLISTLMKSVAAFLKELSLTVTFIFILSTLKGT
jgi:hypothetical protein